MSLIEAALDVWEAFAGHFGFAWHINIGLSQVQDQADSARVLSLLVTSCCAEGCHICRLLQSSSIRVYVGCPTLPLRPVVSSLAISCPLHSKTPQAHWPRRSLHSTPSLPAINNALPLASTTPTPTSMTPLTQIFHPLTSTTHALANTTHGVPTGAR